MAVSAWFQTVLDLGWELDDSRFNINSNAEGPEACLQVIGDTLYKLCQEFDIWNMEDEDDDELSHDSPLCFEITQFQDGGQTLALTIGYRIISFDPWAIRDALLKHVHMLPGGDRYIRKGMAIALATAVFLHELRHTQVANIKMRPTKLDEEEYQNNHDSFAFEQDADEYAICMLLDRLGLTA